MAAPERLARGQQHFAALGRHRIGMANGTQVAIASDPYKLRRQSVIPPLSGTENCPQVSRVPLSILT